MLKTLNWSKFFCESCLLTKSNPIGGDGRVNLIVIKYIDQSKLELYATDVYVLPYLWTSVCSLQLLWM